MIQKCNRIICLLLLVAPFIYGQQVKKSDTSVTKINSLRYDSTKVTSQINRKLDSTVNKINGNLKVKIDSSNFEKPSTKRKSEKLKNQKREMKKDEHKNKDIYSGKPLN
jgi:hypothetical protein